MFLDDFTLQYYMPHHLKYIKLLSFLIKNMKDKSKLSNCKIHKTGSR